MRCTLRKLHSTHSHLRTDSVAGQCVVVPAVGNPFLMFGPPLEAGYRRVVTTTPVVTLEQEGRRFVFTTENSTYELTIERTR